MSNSFYVYGLFDPDEGFPFYIGKGSKGRMKQHFFETRKGENKYKDNKIEKIKRQGRRPYAQKLYKSLNEDEAYMREWCLINVYYEKLTNIRSNYGEGAPSGEQHPLYGESLNDEAKEKLRGKNNPMYGKNHTKEAKEKMKGPRPSIQGKKNSMYGKSLSEETKAKISKANTGNTHSKDAKRKMSEAKSGEKHPNSKLNSTQASEIKWLVNQSEKTQKQISEMYGVSIPTVSYIKNNKRWTHVNSKSPEQ